MESVHKGLKMSAREPLKDLTISQWDGPKASQTLWEFACESVSVDIGAQSQCSP